MSPFAMQLLINHIQVWRCKVSTIFNFSISPQAEVKQFLEKAHGLKVESVRTLNVEGKKKRSKTGFYRRVDYKKVFVSLKEPTPTGGATAQQ